MTICGSIGYLPSNHPFRGVLYDAGPTLSAKNLRKLDTGPANLAVETPLLSVQPVLTPSRIDLYVHRKKDNLWAGWWSDVIPEAELGWAEHPLTGWDSKTDVKGVNTGTQVR